MGLWLHEHGYVVTEWFCGYNSMFTWLYLPLRLAQDMTSADCLLWTFTTYRGTFASLANEIAR